MRIVYNGIERNIDQECSIAEYLEKEGLKDKTGIAVAINETVIPRKDWNGCKIKNDDIVLVIKATQGG